jgi:hypothetical protein
MNNIKNDNNNIEKENPCRLPHRPAGDTFAMYYNITYDKLSPAA